MDTTTVLHPRRLLPDEGLLEFRRGRGICSFGTLARAAVVFARGHLYRADEATEVTQDVP